MNIDNKRVDGKKEKIVERPKRSFNHDKRRLLVLMITHRCNLNCSYCYEKFKSNKTMTFELAQKSILENFEYVQNSDTFKELEINFFGGEPFLEFDLMKRIMEWTWSEPRPVPYLFTVQTNGTLLTEKIKQWCAERKDHFKLLISYDGKDSQNVNRSNSLDKLDLEFYKNTYPEQAPKMTISPDTVDHLADDVIDAYRYGVFIEAGHAYGADWNEERCQVYERELLKLVDFYLENPQYPLLLVFTRPLKTALLEGDPIRLCGAGGEGMCIIDVDGNRYPCHLFTTVCLDEEKLNKLQQIKDFSKPEVYFEPRCASCSYRNICKQCYGYNFIDSGSVSHLRRQDCLVSQVEVRINMKFKALLYERKIQNNIPLTNDELQECKAILYLQKNPPLTIGE